MKRGFTLVEVLVVLTIGLLLVAAAAPIYSQFQTFAQVEESQSQIVQTLRTAKQRAEIRYNNSAHGVYFLQAALQDSYILYQGESYATRSTTFDRVVPVSSAIVLTTDFIGNDINFAAGTGAPSQTGTVSITHSAQGSATISVNDIGRVTRED